MARNSSRARLSLSDADVVSLSRIASSRTEPAGRVTRAKVLLAIAAGDKTGVIAERLGLDPTTVRYTRDKAVEFGTSAALDDLARPGRPNYITADAKAWVVSLACQKPVAVGLPHELWSLRLLCKHAMPIARQNPKRSALDTNSPTYAARYDIGSSAVSSRLLRASGLKADLNADFR